jgi:uncharacterized membrane protein
MKAIVIACVLGMMFGAVMVVFIMSLMAAAGRADRESEYMEVKNNAEKRSSEVKKENN